VNWVLAAPSGILLVRSSCVSDLVSHEAGRL